MTGTAGVRPLQKEMRTSRSRLKSFNNGHEQRSGMGQELASRRPVRGWARSCQKENRTAVTLAAIKALREAHTR